MQRAEATRANQGMTMLDISKSFIIPGVHRNIHVFQYHRTDGTPFTLERSTQGIGIPRRMYYNVLFPHMTILSASPVPVVRFSCVSPGGTGEWRQVRRSQRT